MKRDDIDIDETVLADATDGLASDIGSRKIYAQMGSARRPLGM
ncbi:hypothetical protein WBP07_25010 [Novosphingobium sp. BL-8A]